MPGGGLVIHGLPVYGALGGVAVARVWGNGARTGGRRRHTSGAQPPSPAGACIDIEQAQAAPRLAARAATHPMTVPSPDAPPPPYATALDRDAFLSGTHTAPSLVARLVAAATAGTGGELTPAAADALAAEFERLDGQGREGEGERGSVVSANLPSLP